MHTQTQTIQAEANRTGQPHGSRGKRPLLLISAVLGLAASVTAVVITRRRQQEQRQESQALSPLEQLVASQFMNLTTFRRSGDLVVTTVWFAEDMGTFYVQTSPHAGKVKRIRNSGRVILAPSTRQGTPIGAPLEAHARILHDAQEIDTANAALAGKYGFQRTLFSGMMNMVQDVRRKPRVAMAYLAITIE